MGQDTTGYLSRSEFAAAIGRSYNTVKAMERDGRIQGIVHIQRGSQRHPMFPPSEVERLREADAPATPNPLQEALVRAAEAEGRAQVLTDEVEYLRGKLDQLQNSLMRLAERVES